jgi:hypothetical protein
MGLFTKDIMTMEDLFLNTLQDLYYAENQIVKSLPKMIEKATNRELSAGLRNHLRETEKRWPGSTRSLEILAKHRRAPPARHPPPQEVCCPLHSPQLSSNNVTKPQGGIPSPGLNRGRLE